MKLKHLFKWHWGTKDGGPESKVWCYGFESKLFFSVLVLRFDMGTREAFHTHAFNALSWVLYGLLWERHNLPDWYRSYVHRRSWKPIYTSRDTCHQVEGCVARSWVLTLRGPWIDKWQEILPGNRLVTLTHGRKEVTA